MNTSRHGPVKLYGGFPESETDLPSEDDEGSSSSVHQSLSRAGSWISKRHEIRPSDYNIDDNDNNNNNNNNANIVNKIINNNNNNYDNHVDNNNDNVDIICRSCKYCGVLYDDFVVGCRPVSIGSGFLVCTYVLKTPPVLKRSISQLNGSHGEVTEDDDMGIEDALEQLNGVTGGSCKKSFDKKLYHQRQTDNRNKDDKREKPGKGSGKRISKNEHEHENKMFHLRHKHKLQQVGGSEIEVENVVEYVLKPEPGVPELYCYRGTILTEPPFGVQVCQIPYRTIIRVKDFGAGWFSMSSIASKNVNNYLLSPLVFKAIDKSYHWMDSNLKEIYEPELEVYVYAPLFSELVSKVNGRQYDQSMVASAMFHSQKECYHIDHKIDYGIMDATVRYFLRTRHHKQVLSRNTESQIRVLSNNSVLGFNEAYVGQNALRDVAYHYESCDKERVAWRQLSVEPQLELDWLVRDDFKILSLTNTAVLERDGNRYFDFGPDGGGKPKPVTKFFEFGGLHQDSWAKHSFSNYNLRNACKRLIGARSKPGSGLLYEKELRLNSYNIALRISKSFTQFPLVLEYAKGNRVFSDVCLIPENFMNVIDVLASNLKDRCARGFYHLITDSLRNVVHDAKYKLYKLACEYSPFYSRELYAQIPHIKKKLRESYVKGRKWHSPEYLGIKELSAQLKDEVAKYGKSTRLYMSLDSESMYAPHLAMMLKQSLHGFHHYNINGIFVEIFIYAQPTDEDWNTIGRKIREAEFLPDYLFFWIHSDDSCVVGNVHGETIRGDIDVSSNDSGQDAAAFSLCGYLQSLLDYDLACGLMRLASLPIRIKSATTESSALIQFDGMFEPSGHSNTSVWNHLGSLMIALGISYSLSTIPHEPLGQRVKIGAEWIGHVVTWKPAACIEQLQLLKNSFLSTSSGEYVISANLGRLLRNIGQVEDDLTCVQLGVTHVEFSAMTQVERMEIFFAAQIEALKNEPSCSILDAFRERFNVGRCKVNQVALDYHKQLLEHKAKSLIDRSHLNVENGMRKRYSLSQTEIDTLVHQIRNLRIGDRLRSIAVAKIMHVDYDIPIDITRIDNPMDTSVFNLIFDNEHKQDESKEDIDCLPVGLSQLRLARDVREDCSIANCGNSDVGMSNTEASPTSVIVDIP